MKDIVIKKTSDESQRIVLQTDSETLDYQSRFTVMTVTGNIDGLVNPFHVGSVTSLYEISQFWLIILLLQLMLTFFLRM